MQKTYECESIADVNFELGELNNYLDQVVGNYVKDSEPVVQYNGILAEIKTLIQNLEIRIAGIESRETTRDFKYAEIELKTVALEAESK